MTHQRDSPVTRRRLLSGTAAVVSANVAGCTGGGPSDEDTDTDTPTHETVTETSTATTQATDTQSQVDCSAPTQLQPGDVKDGGSLSKGCYLAEQTLAIENGVLEIAPGTVIQFASGSGLSVNSGGALRAEGSKSAGIRFTGTTESRGSWKGVRFKNTTSNDNILNYATIEYGGESRWHGAGYSRAGIFVENGVKATIQNVTLKENSKMALTAPGRKAELTIENLSFIKNEAPIWVQANVVKGIDESLAFDSNDASYIQLGFDGKSHVPDSATWPALRIPYRAHRPISVAAPVTIEPGATLEFEQDDGMLIHDDGRLAAKGTEDTPIVFTGVEDIPGYWQGLYFFRSLSTDNVLQHVVIEYGGSTRWHGGGHSVANLFLRGGEKAAAVDITKSTIRGSGKYGICKENKARVIGCDEMLFENNSDAHTFNAKTEAPISNCQ